MILRFKKFVILEVLPKQERETIYQTEVVACSMHDPTVGISSTRSVPGQLNISYSAAWRILCKTLKIYSYKFFVPNNCLMEPQELALIFMLPLPWKILGSGNAHFNLSVTVNSCSYHI